MIDKPINKELFFLKTYLAHYEMLGSFMNEEEKKNYENTKAQIRQIEINNKLSRF